MVVGTGREVWGGGQRLLGVSFASWKGPTEPEYRVTPVLSNTVTSQAMSHAKVLTTKMETKAKTQGNL